MIFSNNPKEIIKITEEKYGLQEGTLISKIRTKGVVRARAEVARCMHEKGFSTTEIGNKLNRDHTTIINLLRKFRSGNY